MLDVVCANSSADDDDDDDFDDEDEPDGCRDEGRKWESSTLCC